MKIVIFTALKEERAALRRAWPTSDSGTLMGFPFDSGERVVGFCSGVGAERMRAAVQQARKTFEPSLAILLGFSAGLRDGLAVGEVICDDRGDAELVEQLRALPTPLRFGRVAASGFLSSVDQKRALALEYPDCLAADLESVAFMQAAAGIPHLVLRAVSDDVETPLPLPFEELLSAQGFPDDRAILGKLVRKPMLLPEVWNLAQNAFQAQKALEKILTDIKPLLIRRHLAVS